MDVKRKLLAAIRRADFDFGLFEKGDKIMVGVSGGKDSMVLLYLLSIYQKFADKDFSFVGVMLDLGFPKNDLNPIFEFTKRLEIPFQIVDAREVYPILSQHMKGTQLPCSICSRMKKASINKAAHDLGFSKVSFAHHADDAIETLLMNMTHGGRLATFAPKMFLERSKIEFIRPLIYCREDDITRLASQCEIPIVKSTCTNDKTSERAVFKHILDRHYEKFADAHDNFLTMLLNEEKSDLWFNMLGYSNGDNVFIKKAITAEEMNQAVYIRTEVFLKEQKIDPAEEFDGSDFGSTSYLLTVKSKPIGTLRVFKETEDTFRIGRLAILKAFRHQGYAKMLLHFVEKKLSQDHTPINIVLNAQEQALDFYKKCNYTINGDSFMEAEIPHRSMIKTILKPIMDKSKSK